ncbi:MAG: hypothetical protein BMS9Abin03_532 [Thermodesulfobacteriota bacterium]|nr:MAG: hypothetical protein BMS9Abin03_532 [Thermodesulfobacteriota bacterium]
MTRIVIDTNILVSAILTPKGNPAKILKLVLEGKLNLIIPVYPGRNPAGFTLSQAGQADEEKQNNQERGL